MFNLAIDSKLRGCDLVSLRVQGNAYVDGAVCMALRQALGVVPDAQEVAA